MFNQIKKSKIKIYDLKILIRNRNLSQIIILFLNRSFKLRIWTPSLNVLRFNSFRIATQLVPFDVKNRYLRRT